MRSSDASTTGQISAEAYTIPITLGIFRYIGNNTTQWNSIMATAVIASVPTAFLLILAQRTFWRSARTAAWPCISARFS